VEKNTEDIQDEKTPLGDRLNTVYMGSAVTNGRGRFIVTGTGMDTEIGKIAGMIQQTETMQTPLQKNLAQLGKILAIGALIACAVIFGVGIARGGNPLLMFMTAVSLAVAAIPEGPSGHRDRRPGHGDPEAGGQARHHPETAGSGNPGLRLGHLLR